MSQAAIQEHNLAFGMRQKAMGAMMNEMTKDYQLVNLNADDDLMNSPLAKHMMGEWKTVEDKTMKAEME